VNLTLAAALAEARARSVARLDAQLLLAHVAGRTRSWVIAHDDHVLDTATQHRWHTLLERRAAGEPLAYLTGEREFRGLTLRVTPDVLIPRPDTELLLEWALERIDAHEHPQGVQQSGQATFAGERPPTRVLDIGTGSGAIALALKDARPTCEITGVDISVPALQVAQHNGERLGLPVCWRLSDGLTALADETFDVIVANLPYVAEGDPHLVALRHEPLLALTSGPDGLDAIRQVIATAAARLSPNGWLLLEHGWDQAEQVSACLQQHGYRHSQTRRDLAGQPRCTGACTPA
jgi:release factor glutamine methyltransferase